MVARRGDGEMLDLGADLSSPTGREFIPILGLLQELLPSWLFGHVGAPVFCFLFGFNTRVRVSLVAELSTR